MARVSIITPAKIDGEQDLGWLGDAIQSVMKQKMKDWEMVIVNDHSSYSWKSLKELFTGDKRVKGMAAPAQRIGVAHARNQAAASAASELLLPMDADDILPEGSLARYLQAWEQGGSGQGIVYGDTIFFGPDSQRLFKSAPYDFNTLLGQLIMPVGGLHRKSDWERVGGWKPQMEFGLEDWEYWIALGEIGVCGHYIPLPLYHYRRHAEGRLATLRKKPNAYNVAYQRMRTLHLDTYSGRRSVKCCTGGTGGGGSAMSPSRVLDEHGVRTVLANLGSDALVPMEYIGRGEGFYVTGRPSGIGYSVPGPGELLILPDGRRGVVKKDVKFILSLDRGTTFRIRL